MTKMQIAKMTQRCARHLERIVSQDEVLRRFLSVLHSNDPIARALTLRFAPLLCPFVIKRDTTTVYCPGAMKSVATPLLLLVHQQGLASICSCGA